MASSAVEEQAYLDGTHPALVGGQSTTAPRERASSISSLPDSDDEAPRFTAVDDEAPTSAIPDMDLRGGSGGATRTGPKGVIADWKAAQLSKAEDAGRALPGMAKLALQPVVISLTTSDDEEEWGTGVDDEAAISRYRQQRIAELAGSGTRGGVGKVFGHLREIGEQQFLAAVEDEARDVAVVLHLYEPEFEACDRLNTHLSAIARAYPHTKFLRALATEVEFSTDTEEDTLPTLLVYRGGDLETTLVRVDREWGRGTRGDVVDLLVRHGTIAITPTVPFPTSSRTTYSRTDSD